MSSCIIEENLVYCLFIGFTRKEVSGLMEKESFAEGSSHCRLCSVFRPKRLTLRSYKEYWFVFKDTNISYYKNKEASSGEPIEQFHLRGQLSL